MSDTPWRQVAPHLIGVIDLKNGSAVHGVAGERDRYDPVRLSNFRFGATDGNPFELLSHYSDLGLNEFYLADLDSLGGRGIQHQCIESLVGQSQPDTRWIIDAGLHDPNEANTTQWLCRFMTSQQRFIQWVVASECAINFNTPADFAQVVGNDRVVLGIDFRAGRFIGPRESASPSEEDSLDNHQNAPPLATWIRRSTNAGIRSVLILDVAAVGTSRGPVSLAICRRFRRKYPDWRIISGGGCRDPSDAQAFLDAGCDDCLVATALHC